MSTYADNEEVLLLMIFQDGSARYMADFRIVISGMLWPRELKFASEAIQAYKELRIQLKKGETT